MSARQRTVIVTGAARRVGRQIALHLAEHGWDVAVHYNRSEDEAREVAEAIRAMGRRSSLIPGDLADPASPGRIIDLALREHGRIEALVNNAAVFPETPIESLTAEQFARVLQVNLIAPVMLAAAIWPHFRANGEGRIVNLVDIYADRPLAGRVAYCAAKAGLVTATRALARAMAPAVRVNGVAPGIALFPEESTPEQQERVLRSVPLGRPGEPRDIARTVRFLLEEADYITGQVIAVDGGRSIAW